jgi:hypothetical protein
MCVDGLICLLAEMATSHSPPCAQKLGTLTKADVDQVSVRVVICEKAL